MSTANSAAAVVPFAPRARSRVSPEKEGITSVIARTSQFEGTLRLNEGIKIDGRVTGDVIIAPEGNCLCILDAGAMIEGSLNAPRAWLAGHIRGDVVVGELKLFPQARIDGNIVYDRLLVADGAEINGRLMRRIDTSQESLEGAFAESPAHGGAQTMRDASQVAAADDAAEGDAATSAHQVVVGDHLSLVRHIDPAADGSSPGVPVSM